MLKKLTFILALTTLTAASTISPAFASHRTTVCGDVTVTGGEVLSGSFRSVVVPEGATCTLRDSTVEKDVLVLEGARLTMEGTQVGDDLRGRSPASVVIDCRSAGTDALCDEDSTVDDDIVISGTSSGPNRICNTTVGDDLEIEDSTGSAPWDIGGAGACAGQGDPPDAGGNVVEGDMEIEDNDAPIRIANNTISKDLEVEDNTALVTITNNTIGDDLECDDNTPPPASGGSATNSVGDDARGQCATGFEKTTT